MRSTLIITLFALLGLSQAQAATVTANASATILEPVKISLELDRERYAQVEAAENALQVVSFNDIHYTVSHNGADRCLQSQGNAQLAMGDCQSFTVNFN
ncbi:MAG: hypothetical protein HUJ29_13990 [Gammaproteobacteria bacterium]|nr:hypothetical protein [Gammaproteobacteria bacterium]